VSITDRYTILFDGMTDDQYHSTFARSFSKSKDSSSGVLMSICTGRVFYWNIERRRVYIAKSDLLAHPDVFDGIVLSSPLFFLEQHPRFEHQPIAEDRL